jgi:hypothetical protein
MKRFVGFVLLPLALIGTMYFFVVLNWNYSSGERAGWVQKFSKKGWVCKTWEGELAMVSMPGAAPEKFYFTVKDDAVADRINKAMGRRVSLHYEEKVGLPTSCFGDTQYWVNNIMVVPEIPLAPGITVPVPPEGAPQTAPAQPQAPSVQPPTPVPQIAPGQSPAPATPAPAPTTPAPQTQPGSTPPAPEQK